jgi:hypothetical protein
MKYRMLRKNEKPEAAKGDECLWPGGLIWLAVHMRGECTVEEMRRAGYPCRYRRPANAEKKGGAK